MNDLTTDLERAKTISSSMEAIATSGLDVERAEAKRKYDILVNQLNAAMKEETLPSAPPRSPAQVAVMIAEMLDFVCGAYAFYGKLKSLRPFTPVEKEVCKDLTLLLGEAEAMLTRVAGPPRSDMPVLAVDDKEGV